MEEVQGLLEFLACEPYYAMFRQLLEVGYVIQSRFSFFFLCRERARTFGQSAAECMHLRLR